VGYGGAKPTMHEGTYSIVTYSYIRYNTWQNRR
jgi:hypothetical protein